MTKRVLVADDEPSVREAVGYALKQEGFEVTIAEDGDDADSKLQGEIDYDLLILDIMMPGKSGLDVCRDVRVAQPRADHPADGQGRRGGQGRRARGRRRRLRHQAVLGPRADRPRARSAAPPRARPLELGGRRQDHRRGRRSTSTSRATSSWSAASPVNLTRSEFQVLRLLAENPGQVFSRLEIMEELWQSEFSGDVRACDVHISNLRQKVERDPQDPELVLTVRGVGYRLAEGSSE